MLILLTLFSLSQEIVIYHTNDILGGFSTTRATFLNPDFPPPLGRGPSLSTLLSNARNTNPDLLLLDAGNFMPEAILPQDIDTKHLRSSRENIYLTRISLMFKGNWTQIDAEKQDENFNYENQINFLCGAFNSLFS